MVKRLRLNEKALRNAEVLPDRNYQIFDSEVRGFWVAVYRTGARTFTLDYRHNGRQRRMTIGRWPEWTTVATRQRAKDLRREIDEGRDPMALRDERRDAPRIKDMVVRYIDEHLPKLAPANAADQRSMLNKLVLPVWGNREVTEITKWDVEKLLNRIAEGRARPSNTKPNNRARKLQRPKPTPVRANRTGEVLRKMFTLAMCWGWCEENPALSFCRRVENARERFLSHEEIRRFWRTVQREADLPDVRILDLSRFSSGPLRA